MKFSGAAGRMVLAGVTLLLALAYGAPQHAQQSSATTRLQLTDQVLMPSVTRLGINLGEQTFYDSGQMNRNLIFRNPGFEGLAYRTLFHCVRATTGRCTDTREGIQFPDTFWNGAYVELVDGRNTGSHGVVTTASSSDGGYTFSFAPDFAVGAGDWISVYKGFYGEPTAGWWPKQGGQASFLAERKDLPPGSAGRQALRIRALDRGAWAQISSYLDSTEGKSFLRLQGRYRLSFRARSIAGGRTVHVHVARLAPGVARYLNEEIPITTEWASYGREFRVNEGQLPPAAIEVTLGTSGSETLLDDVALERVDGDPSNHTVFRDEVLESLRELHPGVLRMMGIAEQMGATIDNLLAPTGGRVRAGYLTRYTPTEDISISIPEFLELCQAVDAEPWITLPAATNPAEARKLGEYLASGTNTAGGALRVASGHRQPWSESFRTIHVELGNETWNSIYQGATMEDAAAFGRRANQVFAALRSGAGPAGKMLDLIVGTHVANAGRNRALLAAAPEANTLAIAPYLRMEVNRWRTDEDLFAPLLAEPEQMAREGVVKASAASAGSRSLAVYEVNLHSTQGAAPAAALDRLTPSTAAGVTVADHMLRMMRDYGARNQALFALPQYQFKRADDAAVRLWGAVVEMGREGNKRPQFLAEALANQALHGDLVRVALRGEDPVRDLAQGDGVVLTRQHLLDAYGVRDGAERRLIVFNLDLRQSHRVVIERGDGAMTVSTLSSSSPASNNEGVTQVIVRSYSSVENELTLPPCSMTVMTWRESR